MRAIVFARYGSTDVLELKEIAKPVVKDDEVLVRVRAGGANPYDWRVMRGDPYLVRLVNGLRRPRRATVLGSDMAGQVEAVGSKVTRFRPGDEVFAEVDAGGFAEYVSVREHLVGLKPANLTFEQAAAVPMTGLTALQGLRDRGRIAAGQRVLINGASGGIGTIAVQIAKSFGAEVTGVCSTRNLDMVRSIGADHVVDYTREDFADGVQRYDLILDTVGNRSLRDLRRALVPKGTLVVTGGGGGRWLGPAAQIFSAMAVSPFVSQRLVPVYGTRKMADLDVLKGLIEAGKITPVIDRTYPLSEVREAINYLETRHVQGKVVITL
ncbi:MAG: NAD(P)-dependent alcohol dehydrogenase [Chloroflexota bacterium]